MHLRIDLVSQTEQFTSTYIEMHARLCDLQTPAFSFEQPYAVLGFHSFYVLAQRWLSDMEYFGSSRNRFPFDDGLEVDNSGKNT